MFNIGDKVRLNEEWGKWNQYYGRGHQVGEIATVVGHPRDKSCTKIIFEGRATPYSYHTSFLTRVEQ